MNKANFEGKKTVFSLLGPGLFSPCVSSESRKIQLKKLQYTLTFQEFEQALLQVRDSTPGLDLIHHEIIRLISEKENCLNYLTR